MLSIKDRFRFSVSFSVLMNVKINQQFYIAIETKNIFFLWEVGNLP